MPRDRFYTEDALFVGADARLAPAEDLHMRKVMRKKAGDRVEIFNGTGKLFEAEVLPDGLVQIKKLLKEEETGSSLIIAQALIAPGKLDWVVEKCAELGAASLWLYPADHSEKKIVSDTLLTRLHNIAISAAKQSGRLFVMGITCKQPLKKWPNLHTVYFGSTDPHAPSLRNFSLEKDAVFVIGPEKGFSENELSLFSKNRGVSLSRHILRTETAALVLLSHFQED